MSGKTIGRTKPDPDLTRVIEAEIIAHDVDSALSRAEAIRESEKPTPTERGLRAQVVLLQRRCDQAEARAVVLMNGGDRSNLSRPVGNAFEWMREFTERMLAMGDMTPNARAAKFNEMLREVKAAEEQRKKFAADVELDAADFAAKRKERAP